MNKWITSVRSSEYDHVSSFAKKGFIDWRQYANYEAGDIVYIYCTLPEGKVMYKTVVVQSNMPYDTIIKDDGVFWLDKSRMKNAGKYKYARLRPIAYSEKEELSLGYLLKNGLNAAPQGAYRVSEELANYMDQYLTSRLD